MVEEAHQVKATDSDFFNSRAFSNYFSCLYFFRLPSPEHAGGVRERESS